MYEGRLKRLAAITMVAGGCGGPVTGEYSAQLDTAQIFIAAARWADSAQSRPEGAPLVVLERLDRWRGPAPEEFRPGGIRRLPLENASVHLAAIFQGTDQLSGVLVCAGRRGPREDRLCEREPPWRVVAFSFPHIVGDSAVIGLSLLAVERTYDGGSDYSLLMHRTNRGWQIAQARHTGEID
jgi:hypothetical protein